MNYSSPISGAPTGCDVDERTRSRAAWLTSEFRTSYAWLKSKLQRRVGSPADAEDLASSSFAELADVQDVTA
ncbi:RNA polymerase subunit sigma, partial [Alcaligenes phenolicus]